MNDNVLIGRLLDGRGRRLVLMGLVGLGVLLAGGCNKTGSDERADAATALVALRPAVVADGVASVPVDRLMRQSASYGGRLAVVGVVVQCTPDRGAMLLVDIDEFKSCGLNACTDAAMPVRIDPAVFDGAMPPPGTPVTMIGDFEALERGFEFSLVEMHHAGGVVLARRGSSEG